MSYVTDFEKEFEFLREQLQSIKSLPKDKGGKRRKKALEDYETFQGTYFPHLVTTGPSLFHKWLFKRTKVWGPGSKDLTAAPRGNAKTTHFSRLYPLFRIAKGDIKYILLGADSADQAKGDLEAIKIELEENPRLQQDFPKICGAGRVWQTEMIITASGVKVQPIGVRKRILGANYAGTRPQLVILNDLENEDNIVTAKQRERTQKWIETVIMPLGPPDGSMQIVYTGTIKHHDSAMVRIKKRGDFQYKKFKAIIRYPDRMDLWDEWEDIWKLDSTEGKKEARKWYEERRAEMDRGAQVIWPEMQPLYDLMALRAASPTSFNSEYQNNPKDEENAIFKKIHQYGSIPGRQGSWRIFGAVDPALGKKRRDYTAIVVLAMASDRRCYTLEADIGRYDPMKTITKIIEYQRKWNCIRWGLEQVAFQEVLQPILIEKSLEAGVPVPVKGIPAVTNISKEIRIESLGPHVDNGIIKFHPSHAMLMDQLENYTPSIEGYDDGPDALEIAFKMAYRGPGKMNFKTSDPPQKGF